MSKELFTVRSMLANDLKDAISIYTKSFSIPNEGPHVAFFSMLNKFFPENWFIVHSSTKGPVAIVAVIEYDYFVYVGFMCVNPKFQRHGVGKLLMDKIINQYGHKTILLDASASGYPLYKKLGFHEIDKAHMFILDQMAFVSPPSSEFKIKQIDKNDYENIFFFDQNILGVNRTKLLVTLFDIFFDRSFVAFDNNGEVVGFIVGQWKNIGPFIATKPQVAKELLHKISGLNFQESPTIIIPDSNQDGISIVKKIGVSIKINTHMFKGQKRTFNNRSYIYGQGSMATG